MKRIWAALLLLPSLTWGASYDSDSYDSTNSYDTNSYSFPSGATCGVNDTSPTPGTTISISGCPAFAGTITTLTSPGGDTIPAQGGASTTAADFAIPAALTGFIAAGSMQDTEWALDGTWTVGDGSTTENITLRIDPPGTTGPTHFFGTVVGPEAGDSVFPPSAAATNGDEYYVTLVSGSGLSVNPNGSTSASGDYEVNATIWDESDNGGAGRWSAVENTVFDATSPTLQSAVIDSNGTLFTLTLDEAASQGAGYDDSDLTLTCSGGAVTLTYSAGDGTTTPDYSTSRTIEAGETCTVSFNGDANSLEDAVGNDVAAFTDESVTNNSSGDETAPQYSSSSIPTAGTSISVVFDENINRGGSYSDGDWTVSASGGAVTLTYSSGDGTTTLVLGTSRTIEAGETVTIAWAGTADGLEDDAGNDLAAVSARSVTNNSTADVTAPLFSSSAIATNGTDITITFDGSVTIGAGGNGGFAIASCSGGAVTPTYSSGDGSATLTYSLSRTIDKDETGCTVAYTQPGNGVEDAAGNDVATFGAQSVTNNSTQDLVVPTVSSATINDTVYRLFFSESGMTHGAGGTGGHTLSCSGGAVTVSSFDSGDGGQVFSYTLSRTVAAGETCTRSYTQPTNGVEDAAGNDLATYTTQAVSVITGAATENCPAVLPSTVPGPVKTPTRLPKCA